MCIYYVSSDGQFIKIFDLGLGFLKESFNDIER